MTSPTASLNLQPLGAGDLIDRSIRLYRRNFWTLLRIAAPPVVVSAVGSLLLTVGWRGLAATGSAAAVGVYVLLVIAGVGLWFVGTFALLMVMGGAARNLVRHLLWGEPITVLETYRNVRTRFFGLLAATLIVGTILFVAFWTVAYGWLMLVGLAFVGAALLESVSTVIAVIVGVVFGLAATVLAGYLFFLIAGRFAYVPQVLLVEGAPVFGAIGRSATLASGNAKRLAALVVFSTFAAYSALVILLLPLIWYANANGIPLFSFEPDAQPVWFSIAYQVVGQLSFILLAPVWMLGLSLLYVDERVRREAYDVELLAARYLGEMPPLTNGQTVPLHPALAMPTPTFAPVPPTSNITTLELNK